MGNYRRMACRVEEGGSASEAGPVVGAVGRAERVVPVVGAGCLPGWRRALACLRGEPGGVVEAGGFGGPGHGGGQGFGLIS